MSRIYEALKRSGRPQGAEPSEFPSTTVPLAGADEPETLDEYPVETGSAFRQDVRVEREPARNTGVAAFERVVHVGEERPNKPSAPVSSAKLVSTTAHQGALVSLDAGHKLIVDDGVPASWAESFVELARTLEEMRKSRPMKTLLVMSTQRGEGRTLTAANLALALSERFSRRVLLIDGDVQRPSAGRLFNVSNSFRLKDVLESPARDVPVVEVSPTLSVLGVAASDLDPMTVLVSSGMSGVLKNATAQYDWVLLDTPPLQSLQEPHLLAWMGDGVLLVVGAGTTRRDAAETAVRDLGGHKRIVGVVFNRGTS